jgi:hypothetical protein
VAIYLTEEQAGTDSAVLGFPGLNSCQAIACRTSDGTLVGGHFTGSSSGDVATLNRLHGLLNGRVVSSVYMAYDKVEAARLLKTARGSDSVWRHRARQIGYQGNVYVFDIRAARLSTGSMGGVPLWFEVYSTGKQGGCQLAWRINSEVVPMTQKGDRGLHVTVGRERDKDGVAMNYVLDAFVEKKKA